MSDSIDSELLRAFESDRAGKSFEESLYDLTHAEMWVRLGVADAKVSEKVYKHCEAVFSKQNGFVISPLRIGLSLHYVRSLGARHLLSPLAEYQYGKEERVRLV